MSTDISGSRADLTVNYPLTHCLPEPIPFKDVINVSGHRLSIAEIESALIMHEVLLRLLVGFKLPFHS